MRWTAELAIPIKALYAETLIRKRFGGRTFIGSRVSKSRERTWLGGQPEQHSRISTFLPLLESFDSRRRALTHGELESVTSFQFLVLSFGGIMLRWLSVILIFCGLALSAQQPKAGRAQRR